MEGRQNCEFQSSGSQTLTCNRSEFPGLLVKQIAGLHPQSFCSCWSGRKLLFLSIRLFKNSILDLSYLHKLMLAKHWLVG